MKNSPWKTISSTTVYENSWMKVRRDEVVHTSGLKSTYEVIEQKTHFIVVIPIKDGQLYLVDQFRYPTQQRSIEFPEGGLKTGEAPIDGAKRELQEETGLTSSNITQLGFLYLANGNQTQGYYVFLAEDCVEGKRSPDATEEDLVVKMFTKEEVEKMIHDGTIKDSPTVAAWSLYD